MSMGGILEAEEYWQIERLAEIRDALEGDRGGDGVAWNFAGGR